MVIPAHYYSDEQTVRYLALGKLADLGLEIAGARKLSSTETLAKIKKATQIRLWLQALQYRDYLTKEQRDKIKYALIDISDINDFGTAPVLGNVERSPILIGSGGSTIEITNIIDAGTPILNTDVDAPSEVLDSFPISSGNGVRWEYTVYKGSNLRKGSISAGWLSSGVSIDSGAEVTTADIGDTSDVSFNVDINAGEVRLIATVASNDWIVKGKRYLD